MNTFMKHAGNYLKKFTGVTHEDAFSFDDKYQHIEFQGKVIYNSMDDDSEESIYMVVAPEVPVETKVRTFLQPNPDLFIYGAVNCPIILEPGDNPRLILRDCTSRLSEMDLDWCFRLYFIR